MDAVTTERSERPRVLAANDREDVFNIDETGLFYRIGSNATPATSSVKDRITVALTANSTGSVKIKPFVTAKVARPRCIGNTYYPDYSIGLKAWMTSVLFQDWLKDFNRQIKRANKKVILLVDNPANHAGSADERNSQLPPNTTSNIQPKDAGIIQALKVQYMKQLIRKFISCAEDD